MRIISRNAKYNVKTTLYGMWRVIKLVTYVAAGGTWAFSLIAAVISLVPDNKITEFGLQLSYLGYVLWVPTLLYLFYRIGQR